MPVSIDGDSLESIPLNQAALTEKADATDEDDFDSPVVDALEQQIQDQKNLQEIRERFEKDPGALALVEWLNREQDTGIPLSFTLFKNCNLFRGISRARDEWNRIIAIALDAGWVSTENGKNKNTVVGHHAIQKITTLLFHHTTNEIALFQRFDAPRITTHHHTIKMMHFELKE